MRVFSATDVGNKRDTNQDYLFVSSDPVGNLPNLFVVADGMGGQNAGDFASSHVVQVFVDEIRRDMDYNPVRVMRHALEKANADLNARASQSPEFEGMGTTLVALTIVGKYAYIANIGDSRLYLINKEIRQVTRDHSLVQEMIRLGELNKEEARTHPKKNVITRALGAEKTVNVDFFDLVLEEGCSILMCTDGLTNMVEDKRIEEIMLEKQKTLEERGRMLVLEANHNGGQDNIAIILIDPVADEVNAC
jgi:protein phosphatase